MRQRLFVTGIGTGVGKTVVSAILAQAWGSDYWKPVQSGLDGPTDSDLVRQWAPGAGVIHAERYRLQAPLSPHASAAREGRELQLGEIRPPATDNPLVVEGAGGLLVPLNHQHTLLDLLVQLDYPVVLVSRHYLGSINHTLLSLEALRSRGLTLELLVFVGHNEESESAIMSLGQVDRYFQIGEADNVDYKYIKDQSNRLIEFYSKFK